jgi:uncharacterized protein (UPF0147 family)
MIGATNIGQVITLLEMIAGDRTVPKNIRKVAEDSKAVLTSNEKSEELKISTAIHLLDEITNDPNMPLYTRTQIWNVVSILEQLRREITN